METTNLKIKSTYLPKGVRIDYVSYPVYEDKKEDKKNTFLNLKRLFCGLFKK